MLNGKISISLLTVGSIKKEIVLMSEHFPVPKSLGRRGKVELDLFNYATKADLKNATNVDTSKLAKKVDLTSLKSNLDQLNIDKLAPAPVDLNKLSDVVKNDVVKKDAYNAKIENIKDKTLILLT